MVRRPGPADRRQHPRRGADGITTIAVVLIHWPPCPDAPLFEIEDLHVRRAEPATPRSCGASTSPSAPARSTPSWAPTARASPPWPAPCSAAPSTRSPTGRILLQGRRHHRLGRRRAGQGRHLPRLPVPPGDPRRLGAPVPAPGAVGPQGHRPVGARAAPGDHGVDEAPRHGPVLRRPLPQRGLLRRREEAQRDPADGHPRARAGHPRRDRLRPRHRRPARRGQGRPARCAPTAPSSACWSSPTTSACSTSSRPTVVHILVDGRIVEIGGLELASRLEAEGYDAWRDRSTDDRPRRTDDLDVAADQGGLPAPRSARSTASRIVYLDSAATSQKPRVGARRHGPPTTRPPTPTCTAASTRIAEEATNAMEAARAKVAPLHQRARPPTEVVFTKNATEAHQPGRPVVGRAPTSARATSCVLTQMEHHANIVPWQLLASRDGASRSAGSRSPPTASSTSPTSTACSTAPSCSASPPCPTCSAPSRRCASSPTPPTPPAPWSCVDACQYVPHVRHRRGRAGRRLRRLLRPQDAAGPPASACCGAARSCSTPCRRSSAAAT